MHSDAVALIGLGQAIQVLLGLLDYALYQAFVLSLGQFAPVLRRDHVAHYDRSQVSGEGSERSYCVWG